MKKVLLFDLDGTLTDPALGITNSILYALEKMGFPKPPRRALYPFIGPPLVESFQKYCSMTEAEAQRALALYREYFSVTGLFENEVYEGIPKVGLPYVILVKEEVVRWSTPAESMEYLQFSAR